MNNLVTLTPNCFIIYTQSGWKKLLKKLSCYGNKSVYSYNVRQCTDSDDAFEYNGLMFTKEFRVSKKYPIKYPCIVSYEDDRFELNQYQFYIRYIPKDLKFSEVKNFNE